MAGWPFTAGLPWQLKASAASADKKEEVALPKKESEVEFSSPSARVRLTQFPLLGEKMVFFF